MGCGINSITCLSFVAASPVHTQPSITKTNRKVWRTLPLFQAPPVHLSRSSLTKVQPVDAGTSGARSTLAPPALILLGIVSESACLSNEGQVIALPTPTTPTTDLPGVVTLHKHFIDI